MTIANTEEVFKANYGGKENDLIIDDKNDLVVIGNDIDRSAYILVYIQLDKIHFILKEINTTDVKYILYRYLKY